MSTDGKQIPQGTTDRLHDMQSFQDQWKRIGHTVLNDCLRADWRNVNGQCSIF